MSRRITNQTNITDKAIALHALQMAGIDHQVQGNSIYFKSGALANAVLNLNTGMISGDSDHGHTKESLGMLRQYYSEAVVKSECAKQGVMIDERQTDQEGNIILMWHMA
jgi:hypothetical protein